MPNPQPFDFTEAREAINAEKRAQAQGEEAVRDAYRELALARKAYQVKLAEKILALRADSMAATVCGDIARGDTEVAELRFRRDLAEGVAEAASAAVWRHTANRKDLHELINWSKRVAPDGQHEPNFGTGA